MPASLLRRSLNRRGDGAQLRLPVAALAIALAFCGWGTVEGAEEPNGDRPYLRVEIGTHAGPVRRLAVSAQRQLVVTTSDDKTARVWDMRTGQLRHVLRAAVGPGDVGRLYGAAIHPTEEMVAVGGTTGTSAGAHRILLFSTQSGVFLRSLDARGGDVKNLAWSADGSLLFAAYAGDHALRGFDRNGRVVLERRLQAPVLGLATSSSGTVAATSMDGSVLVLRAVAGTVEELHSLRASDPDTIGVSFSPDGSRLVLGSFRQGAAPELFDVASGASLGKLSVPATRIGHYQSVAWSDDGALIAAAGSARDRENQIEIFFFDAASGRLSSRQTLSADAITDLEPLPGRQFAFSSFDGSWGIVAPGRLAFRVDSAIADMRGASRLRISSDARIVEWPVGKGSAQPMAFDFSTRLLTAGSRNEGLHAPIAKAGWTDLPVWENSRQATVRGRDIPLDREEVSRSLAYFSERQSALLGTSKRLIRLDRNGKISWQIRTPGEVWAVNLSHDDQLAVTALSDGTVRWWRASDGALLLSLVATRDGRWVVWTENGHFDAGPGADRLAGWAVNRMDSPTADFFSLQRFRDRLNRPDAVDRIFRTLQPTTVEEALSLPPILESAGPQSGANEGYLVIPYAVRPGSGGKPVVEVRVNGRPATAVTTDVPASDGRQRGELRLSAPEPGSVVQLLARDGRGVSEPLGFIIEAMSVAPLPSATPEPSSLEPARTVDAARSYPAPAAPPPMQAATDAVLKEASKPQASALKPRLFVLSIGISEYRNPAFRLGLAAKDSTDFAEALKSQAGSLYSEVVVRTLTDGRATREAILSGLAWLAGAAGSRDVGVMFFAGHGINGADGQYYFLSHEADLEQVTRTSVSEAHLRDSLGKMKGRALLFVDTCFGGAALSRAGSSELARMANNLSATENGIVVFASSTGRQLSEEKDEWGNGAFTKAVLAGLSGKADLTKSGRITFKGLDFYVSEEVRRLTDGRQTPVTISPTGVPDFALAMTGT